jgi:hypothetical protein
MVPAMSWQGMRGKGATEGATEGAGQVSLLRVGQMRVYGGRGGVVLVG